MLGPLGSTWDLLRALLGPLGSKLSSLAPTWARLTALGPFTPLEPAGPLGSIRPSLGLV